MYHEVNISGVFGIATVLMFGTWVVRGRPPAAFFAPADHLRFRGLGVLLLLLEFLSSTTAPFFLVSGLFRVVFSLASVINCC